MFRSLYAKLAVVVVGVCLLMGLVGFWMLRVSHETYHLELRQRLDAPLARDLLEHGSLEVIRGGAGGTRQALEHLTRINPHIEVYLLDESGGILASSTPEDRLRVRKVDAVPLSQLIGGRGTPPIKGTDPQDPAQPKIFSVAELPPGPGAARYLYVILRGEEHDMLARRLKIAYLSREWAGYMVAAVLVAVAAGLAMVRTLTTPLRRLTAAMEGFRRRLNAEDEHGPGEIALPATHDEIGRLAEVFTAMAHRIEVQMRTLEVNDAKRRALVANISHDLRTPLASLLGYLETLILREKLPLEERRLYCEIALAEAKSLNYMIDRLFELAKLDSPEAAVSPAVCHIAEVVQSVIRKLSLAAAKKGVTLVASLAADVPAVWADQNLMERVFSNLVENAVSHTSKDGTVSVSAESDAEAVLVRVSDTGGGIAPEDLPRIFDRFYRGEKSRRAASERSGLGLAIVKRILELHGVDIAVESAVGKGTTFTFRLPVAAGRIGSKRAAEGVVEAAAPVERAAGRTGF